MHPKERPENPTDTAPQTKEPLHRFTPNYEPSRYGSYFPSTVESGYKGRFFPVFTLILCLTAVFLEGAFHLCAGIFQMDPIPSPIMLVLYILTVATIGVNIWVLGAGAGSRGAEIRQSPRSLGLLIVSTVVSLVVALTAGYMFLPLIPIGGILLILGGLGMLLWTPYFALIALALQFKQLARAFRAAGAAQGEVNRTTCAAVLAAFALLFWQIGRPMIAANYIFTALHTEGAEQRNALNAARPYGGETILLDIAYHRNPSFWACLGYNAPQHGWWPSGGFAMGRSFSLFGGDNWWGGQPDTAQARRLYFLLTGTPFELAPAPESFKNNPGTFLRGGPTDVAVEETGGMTVGRKIPGLWLAESRIEGDMYPGGDNPTYPHKTTSVVEWTMKFKNDTDQPQEARADIIIPDDAVVHKVSLWINGVEQRARYGHPNRVRKAYQQVAVVQRRDPLLVTMPAPGHVLAQCFPVPAKGEMQIRLGFTQRIRSNNNIELPAFGMVNFDIPKHIPGQWAFSPVQGVGGILTGARIGKQQFLPDYAPRKNTATPSKLTTLANLIVVMDGSQGMNTVLTEQTLKALDEALNILPSGSRVRFMRTDKFVDKTVDWEPGKLNTRFLLEKSQGGYDPVAHLANALEIAAQDKNRPSAVLFLHAASANGVSDLTKVREILQRNYWSGPALIGIHMIPATPDTLIRELSGFQRVSTARAFPESPDFPEQLKSAIGWAVTFAAYTQGESFASEQVELIKRYYEKHEPITDPMLRLILFGKILSSWRYANTLPTEKALDVRIAVGRAAARQRLVTPLSSAVVLETEEQYKENGLEKDKVNDPKKMKAKNDNNFASPEPGALAFLLVGGLAAFPFLRRKWVKA